MTSGRLRFNGKTAVLTGAATGMGKAMSIAFAEAGAGVVGLSSDDPGSSLAGRYHGQCGR